MKKNSHHMFIIVIILLLCMTAFNTLGYKAAPCSASDSDVKILIDLSERMLYVVSNNDAIRKYPVAIGTKGNPSPIGDFQIIEKDRWGEGFGSAWLRLNVPWGTYGIHGTIFPESIGHASSHGCIRMNNSSVNDLYKLVKVGTTVKIIGGLYGSLGSGYRVLAPGDRGADVILVQSKLQKMGFYKGPLDGIYDAGTEKALNKFQKSRNMKIKNRITEDIYVSLGIILFE